MSFSDEALDPALALLPGDNPQAYVPGDRRRALARGEGLPSSCHGSAVFVDISGFTPLTEALARELGARRGAEELTATLDRVFAALLQRLHVWHGSVVYFSGDAVTAWIDGDDGLAATACALEMQRVMDDVGRLTTPGGTEVTLAVKVAIAVGDAHRFVVGDPSVQLIDVLAGRLMDAMADAEQQASAGEVVLDAGALASLGTRVRLVERREGRLGAVGVVAGVIGRPGDPGPPEPDPELPLHVVRRWLLPPVWDRVAAGRGEFLAELRPAVPVFVQLDGLDFDHDPASADVLDAVVQTAQRTLDELGGSVLQLTIGDKGVNLYAVHGSPIAHEDDAARACLGALRLRAALADLPVADVRIGLAAGQLRSGTYGHHERRTFCCLGDAVNLAARLMSRAPAGGILVHGDVARAAGRGFEWRDLDPISVKGKSAPVQVRELLSEATVVPRQRTAPDRLDAMVGRDDEIAAMRLLWDRAVRGDGRVLTVSAEAGGGKSRLVSELVDELVLDGVPVAWGEATRVTGGASYLPWRGVCAGLLGLDPSSTPHPSEVEAAVADLDPAAVSRAPLLGEVLGIVYADNALTATITGELRKTSREDLLTRILRARAGRGPIAVVIDDAHWLDGLARDLLTVLARAARGVACLLVATTRPDEGGAVTGLRGSHVTALTMPPLTPDAAAALVTQRHLAVTGSPPAPRTVATLVGRAEGNPFYLVQLVDYLLGHDDSDPDADELPPSLHTLVLSRIDAQPEGSRRAVKVASVVGRDFSSPLVAHSYPDLGPEAQVHTDLLAMASTRLIDLEDDAEQLFAFGHAVTRDVAYDSLPHGVRTVLHGRVADALEREPDGPVRHLDLLAFHYARSDVLPKRHHYLLSAARAARSAYANAAAVAYLELVLPQVEPHDLPEVLLDLADAQQLAGDWDGAEETLQRTLQAALDVDAPVPHARALTGRAELARKQGRFAEAEKLLVTAELEFLAAGDPAGRAQVLHLRGTLASQQADHAGARAAYEAGLAVRLDLGDDPGVAALLTNLALVAEDEGDLDEAERIGLDALARRRALGDRREVSVSLMNMGMLATVREEPDSARTRFTEALALAEEVGDPWLAAVGRHNLANATRDAGDLEEAATHLAHALAAYAGYDDRWSLAHVLEDIGLWLLERRDDAEAVRVLAAAQALRDEIGAPRFPPTVAALEAALAPARERTPAEDLDAAEVRGAVDVDAAVERAGHLLSSVG